MFIRDAATKTTLDLTSVQDINMYVCGPTVYNHVHLGNIRPLITFDVLHRYLKAANKNVTYVHNITDIDDKIIAQAGIEQIPELTLSARYAQAYALIMERLNIYPTINPKVSENIDGIIGYVKRLVDANKAYVLNGSVYFDVQQATNYGCVSHMKQDELYATQSGVEDNKKHPADFALWKQTQVGITWSSPWGQGRPGWHTECAYLIDAHFGGKTITLHGGGIDLRFPHHENENTQHAALHHNEPITQTWMHVGHLNIGNEKMSKSLNNFVYASQLLDRYGAHAVRWLFYQTHYRSPLSFTNDAMEVAARETARLVLAFNKARSALVLANQDATIAPLRAERFAAALADDLNFANAVQELWNLHKQANEAVARKDYATLKTLLSYQQWCFDIFGLKLPDLHTPENISLLREWDTCVKAKDYAQADALRAKLIAKKIW